MQANIARARAGGGFEPIEVTKEGPGADYREMTVPELIGKQNVIVHCVKYAGTYGYGIKKFVCVPDAGGTFAYGYGEYGSYGSAAMTQDEATYDPNTGKFHTRTNAINYSDRWYGTFKFYAW